MSRSSLLSRGPTPVVLEGRTVMLPWRPAAEWTLHVDRLSYVAALFAPQEDRDWIAARVLAGTSVWDDVKKESYRILGDLTGRKWWESRTLLATSDEPEALGHLTLAGVDPWTTTVGQWCAATYALYTRNLDQQGRLKFDFSLSIPPEGFEDEWDDGADSPAEIEAAVAKMMG